jgi:hypothetical protein
MKDMKLAKRVPRPAVLMALTVVLALCVAACGSSSSTSSSTKNAASTSTTSSKSSTTTTTKASFAAYQACLKKNGVTLPTGRGGFGGRFGRTGTGTTGTFTRPNGTSTTGGGFGGGGFAGGNSKFAKAAKACASQLPKGAHGGFGAGGFGGGGHFGGGAGGSGGTPAFSTKVLDSYVACIRKNGYAAMPEPSTKGGAVFPKSVESNAKFKAANVKCESILRSQFTRPTGAGAGTPPAGASSSGSVTTSNT